MLCAHSKSESFVFNPKCVPLAYTEAASSLNVSIQSRLCHSASSSFSHLLCPTDSGRNLTESPTCESLANRLPWTWRFKPHQRATCGHWPRHLPSPIHFSAASRETEKPQCRLYWSLTSSQRPPGGTQLSHMGLVPLQHDPPSHSCQHCQSVLLWPGLRAPTMQFSVIHGVSNVSNRLLPLETCLNHIQDHSVEVNGFFFPLFIFIFYF